MYEMVTVPGVGGGGLGQNTFSVIPGELMEAVNVPAAKPRNHELL